MKIAFLNIYSGINSRGAESFTHELANKLTKQHQIVFFQAGEKSAEQQYQVVRINCKAHQPQEIFPQNTFKKFQKYIFLDQANRSTLKFSLALLRHLLQEKFDVIFPLNGFWQVILLKMFQPFGKYKIVITGHSGPGWDERWNLYLKPDVFIAITKPGFLWAKKTCSWTRIVLIPLAVNVDVYKEAKSATVNLQRPIILCPSALVPYKRVDLAIRAVSELNQASLLLLGKGVMEQELRELASTLLKNRFMILNVPQNRIACYYKSTDIVTLPSSPQENSPMVFLESMAAEKIVVTTDTERNRWILGKTAIFCNPVKIGEYTKALSEAIKKSKEKDRIQLFSNRLGNFSWSTVYHKYLKIINEI